MFKLFNEIIMKELISIDILGIITCTIIINLTQVARVSSDYSTSYTLKSKPDLQVFHMTAAKECVRKL